MRYEKVKKIRYSIAVLLVLFFASPSPIAGAQTLRIAFGDALPPWVIPENESGILIEIVRQSLEPAGYTVNNVYVPYARRLITYKRGEVDAVCDMNPNIMATSGLEGYLSDMVYAYENIGVSLRRKGFRFTKVSDLETVSIASWQGAKAAIGGAYAEMAAKNIRYSEVADQKLQIHLLYSGRVDVIQLDRQIFHYFRNDVGKEGKINTDQPIDLFPLFGKNECGFLFRDKTAQVLFDRNFEQFKQSGGYEKLLRQYGHSPGHPPLP